MGAALRRIKAPVLGRLAWAWLAFAAVGGLVSAYALLRGPQAGDRIALPVEGAPELMVRPAPPAPARLAEAAPLAEDDAFSVDTDDVFAGGGAEPLETLEQPARLDMAEEPEGAIVITIDGGRERDRAPLRTEPRLASLSGVPSPIPDADPALLVKTPLGARPKIGADGRRAARVYARPYAAPPGRAKVALIVGGLGLNPDLTERAILELPPEVTLAFAPYAKNLDMWTKRAREAGHEIMVELPMETHQGDPAALGPAALLSSRTPQENQQRLDWLLSRFGGYFGATNYLGSKFSSDRAAMDAVLAHLGAAGLAYVDDTGAARRIGAGAAPLAIVNRMVTPGPAGGDKDAALRDLAALAAAAERSGDALGKAYAYDATIEAIAEWARALDEEKLSLAPASAVVEARGREL